MKKQINKGLRGVSAGSTAISTVGKEGQGLSYRGYNIDDLAQQATFEEVAYLLLYEQLPSRHELEDYKARLFKLRQLPDPMIQILERIPSTAHPMDVMRTACSMLGCILPEEGFAEQNETADRLLAVLPVCMCYWYRFSHYGERIDLDVDSNSIAGIILYMLTGDKPLKLHQQCMDASLILYAEHEFNASTFACRVCAATLSDMYSAVVAGIGTLKGPLHGGANEATHFDA